MANEFPLYTIDPYTIYIFSVHISVEDLAEALRRDSMVEHVEITDGDHIKVTFTGEKMVLTLTPAKAPKDPNDWCGITYRDHSCREVLDRWHWETGHYFAGDTPEKLADNIVTDVLELED